MSRQKGTRRPSKVERQARLARYANRRAERVVQKVERFRDPEATPRRRWAAIGWSTALLLLGYFSAIAAIFEFDEGRDASGWGAVATAVAGAGLSLFVLGRVSRAPTPLKTGMVVTPAAIGGFVLLGALTGDPGAAIVLAFGVAGAFTMRLDEGIHSVWRRIGTVGFFLMAVVLFRLVSVDGALTVAPLFPYLASGVTDVIAEREARRRAA